MAGWNLKCGSIKEYKVSEDRIMALFDYVFSDACRKRNTYKFGLIKALLDNIHDGQKLEQGVFLTYEQIFCAFAENYWKLVIKYDLRQMRKDGKSIYSKVETILKSIVKENKLDKTVEFKELDFKIK